MKIKLIMVLCTVALFMLCGTAVADWNVTWTPVKESIIDKEYIIEVQNLQDINRDVNISSFFAETDFDISELSDIEFFEWAEIPYTYTTDHYNDVEHSEYCEINGTWINWTERVFDYTETVESTKLGWDECKSQLYKENGTTKEGNYGFINIPKYESEDDGDGTFNGTKTFKLLFRTPIVYDGSYGSFGKVALLLDGEEHHPYWNTSWASRQSIILTGNTSGAQTDYQMLLNVSWLAGMQTDFDDLRFTNDTNEVDSWLESKVNGSYALVWVEFPTTPANTVEQTYYMYYGKSDAVNYWDGDATFEFFDDFDIISPWTGEVDPNSHIEQDRTTDKRLEITGLSRNEDAYLYKTKTTDSSVLYSKVRITSSVTGQIVGLIGVSDTLNDAAVWQNGVLVYSYYSPHRLTIRGYSGGSSTTGTVGITVDTDYWLEVVVSGTTATLYVYSDATRNTLVGSDSVTVGDVLYSYIYGTCSYNTGNAIVGSGIEDDVRVRKYAASPPTAVFGAEESFAGSIHYNATNPYNHTIESDGTITANHSITAADDINWTAAAVSDDCYLVVTEYNLANYIIANFTISNATLDWLQVTNLTVGVNYSISNGTVIELHVADANGEINFTTDMIVGEYQILASFAAIDISLHSITPTTCYTNYTGCINVSYIVNSSAPIDLSTIAFLYSPNHTLTGDRYNSIRVPANNISYNGIYRANLRNITPYLNWEFNDTITEGNVWKWSGADESSPCLTVSSINSTHTFVNCSRPSNEVFPAMHYLARQEMYAAPKTQVEINKAQGIIFKIYDLEQFRSRGYDYYISLYLDTGIETTPDSNIEIWYCNCSFDPTTDDPTLVGDFKESWSPDRWVDHIWTPDTNASYANPSIMYAGTCSCPSAPCEINYIYLRSSTPTSKSYELNATNIIVPGINVSFANTETMWTYDEISGTSTPISYTPSIFQTFTRNYLEVEYQLYVANTAGTWANSGINVLPVGLSNIPPTTTRFNYFWWGNETDYIMNSTYSSGFYANVTYGFDPDNGGALNHTMSIYSSLGTLVAVINDSLSGSQVTDDIFFNPAGYSGRYQFQIISTDNEGTSVTSWSPVFYLSPTDDESIPLDLFIVLMVLMFFSLFYIYHAETYVSKIVTSLVTTWMSFMLSAMIVSGNVVLNYAELSSLDAFVYGSYPIQVASLSHFFMFTGVVSALFMLTFSVKLVMDTYQDMQDDKKTTEEWDGVE